MTIEFHLPDVGEGLHEAEVVTWLVNVGDVVTRDQPFVEVLTDKSTVELPAPGAGTVTHLGASIGDVVTVGELLIVIDDGSADTMTRGDSPAPDTSEPAPVVTPVPAIPAPVVPAAAASAVDTPQPVAVVAAAQPSLRPKAAPSTRRLAAERGIDLSTITGTGPGGRILAEDLDGADSAVSSNATADTTSNAVASADDLADALNAIDEALLAPPMSGQAAAGVLTAGAVGAAAVAANTSDIPAESTLAPDTATTAPQPAVGSRREPSAALGQAQPGVMALRGVRRLTAKAMDTSWSTIPHITAMNDLDATALMETRSRVRDAAGDAGAAITPLTLMMMAVAQALRTFPLMNATLDLTAETITVHDDVNIGVAVSSDNGLIVPVVRHADTMGVLEMATEIGRLSAAARSRSITSEDLSGGTFTVTNYGSFGGRFASPIIRPGESGIMGFGGIAKRPFVVGDNVEARPTLPVVLACDHRLIDGDLLSAFHNHVIDALADPTSILFKAAL